MGRTRVRWGRVAVLAGVLVSTLWAAGRALGSSEDPAAIPTERLVVRQGETLWGIARGLVGPEGDPRPVVEAIRDSNDLGVSTLLEGQTLVLPSSS
ncbi:MAG: LysM peptidoglycan-binding domain-containing protein [Actinomycetota bacterium]